MHEQNPHRTRRHVRLPGGRQIEVVYLDGAPEPLEETSQQIAQAGSDAHVDSRTSRTSNGTSVNQQPARASSGTSTHSQPARTDSGTSVTPQPPRTGSGTSVDPQPARPSSGTPVAPLPWTGDSPSRAPSEALHVCPRCAGRLVHPLDWDEESPGRWRILMRCPDCEAMREGVFGQALVERLDEELDKATAALLSDLRQLTHANMVEEIEVFSRALDLDLIGPSDF
jgi:hypothetical protein